MRRIPWPTYLWPGLPQLWLDGAWSGLALAVGAATLLNMLLLSTLVWVEWFSPPIVKLGWVTTGGLWIGAAIFAAHAQAKSARKADNPSQDLFRRAQGEYLQGDYFQAEATLADILTANPRDAEARLLLATLLRHTQRIDEAEDQLRQLTRFETAARWQIEITGERARLKRLRKAKSQNLNPKTQTSTNVK